jgi:hypothetical protein
MIQILKRNWQLILIVILVFCLIKSCNNQPTVQGKSYKKEKDSLQKSNEFLEFQINGLAQENSQIIDSLKKFVKQSKITENKLYQLQKKTTIQPAYVDNVIDCNDTIKSIYYIGTIKDSLCNAVISDKNTIISKKDKIIFTDSLQKNFLNKIIDNKNLTIQTEELAIKNEIKKTKSESRKKTFWQIVAGVLTILKFIK